ncbi:MAG: hypothetical protein IH964_13380 [Candidatus Dadabacteria bacterium]|nr:hypothetical protein [Candidatus Dadabacteria bacterium]
MERKKEELKSKEEMFCRLNKFMEDVYSGHRWCKLSLKERRRIYFEQPRGTIDYSNRFLPKFIPFNKKESDLEFEVHSLYAEVIKKEILRRRELTRGKIKNN